MERVEELAGYITRGGMNTIALADARGAQWTKLIFNAATNPVGALTRLHHGAATRFPTDRRIVRSADSRKARRSRRRWASSCTAIREHLVAKGANAPGKHKASMLQDVLASRMTEVDFMNGAIVKWGEKYWRADSAEQSDVGADQRAGAWVEEP